MTKEEIRIRVLELVHQRGQVKQIAGAVGDLEGCSAYEEEIIKEGMWRTKYVGISRWFKGITENEIIDKATITKRAFVQIIKLFPLRINKVINAFYQIYACEGALKYNVLNKENFCPICQELIGTGMKLAARITNEELKMQIKDLIYCFAMFLQFSTTYRAWLQDIAGELDKDNFQKRPLTELLRLKRIFMNRLQVEHKKAKLLWRMAFLIVLFNRDRARQFVKELDTDKMKLDGDDWYYCLRRSSYNFRDKELYTRLVEAELIDLKEGNLVLGI